ncbi:MAG TPA: hypothetical protein VL614_00550 [Acetobacteraceae bacterium]|nr:hypothetical protein [Acetobacteraceae bacterium]
MTDFPPDKIEQLLAAGWIARQGNDLVMTDKGRAALRRGMPGHTAGGKLSIESTLARTKPSIKKKRR